jgi:hypothetical protein
MDEEMVEFSKWYTSSKILLQPTTGNVGICVVDAVMYVVLSKAEKRVPYWEFVGTAE